MEVTTRWAAVDLALRRHGSLFFFFFWLGALELLDFLELISSLRRFKMALIII